ncbi:MAG TPA: hypothetical protein VHC20_03910 [Candidatus Paceibacterota bacterium]|nr:hypothetical protein [Candidatus Paceibacterota bacterium]
MSLITEEVARRALTERPWIMESIDEAAELHTKMVGSDEPYQTMRSRSSDYRDRVVHQIRKAQYGKPYTMIYEPGRGFFSLVLEEPEGYLGCIFKKLRGGRPSNVMTGRVSAINRQELALDLGLSVKSITWTYLGWEWDALEQSLNAKHAICWRNGILQWRIEADGTRLVGYEPLLIPFSEPTTTQLDKSLRDNLRIITPDADKKPDTVRKPDSHDKEDNIQHGEQGNS